MKKIVFSILTPLAVLFLAGLMTGKPARHTLRVMSTVGDEHTGLPAEDSVRRQSVSSSRLLKEELDYYMDRHNLQDEGYEMVVAFAGGKRHQVAVDRYIPLWNVGTWQGQQREGTALVLDSLGRTVVGTCQNNSLVTGIRVDTLGNYAGDFLYEKSSGHGAYTLTDSRGYYEGHWADGRREGFGLSAETKAGGESSLRVGIWRNDRFMGERMRYTTERIYGIDISRYQHGKGRKKYPIHWDRLRITHVGKRGSQNVSGTADYPVSFVYIKSTEGTTIRNRYFAQDYLRAKKAGIHVGAYHFFSLKSSAEQQAKYFVNHTLFRKGDFPPVLDVEPTDAQIRQIGGDEVLMRRIRIFMEYVEKHTGMRPILYISQMFINRHMANAADIKKKYNVWIARYGQYKPDVRLVYWQLCPDGRVDGITGDVDINVFNGYQNQFDEFVKTGFHK